MIFIATGSQKFQFNRLLKTIDSLIQNGEIKESVFAQIGSSTYHPKNYKYIDYMSTEEFSKMLDKCDLVITHGGTGIIVNAIKKQKKVIGVPRLRMYKEHVDDHQIQLLDQFKKNKYIEVCYNLDKLPEAIRLTKKATFEKYKSNKEKILMSIVDFINEEGD